MSSRCQISVILLTFFRHQILIKATNIGLKESSTRGAKKKRESDQMSAADGRAANNSNNSISPTSAPPSAPPSTAPPTTAGSPDRPASTSLSAHQSPALTHAVTMSAPTPSAAAAMMGNWPMPHVAANTPSPVISSSVQPSVGRTPYYRTTDRQTGGK